MLFRRYASTVDARWWIGARPSVGDGRLVSIIAAQVGLPTGNAGLCKRLVRLSRTEAAHVLAVAGTISLAYGADAPNAASVAEAGNALGDLTGDAVFLGNGRWQGGTSVGWNPLTDATFDCGVLGYDEQWAFIFWVEEED